MATKPTTNIDWAETTATETVAIGDNYILVTNVVEPTGSYKNTGVLARQPIIRPYLNWFFREVARWIKYVHEGEVGDTKIMPPTTTSANMATRFGGTWTDHGTLTLAGQSKKLFTKAT